MREGLCEFEFQPNESQADINTFVSYIGAEKPVRIIDVEKQIEIERKWDLGKWRDYFLAEHRLRIFNVISLEFSDTGLRDCVRAPQVGFCGGYAEIG